MTSSRIPTLALLLSTLAACGNYSNEDLEFMNAVPAHEDISANIPRAALLTDEAELSKLTHEVITAFNKMLDFLIAADHIRTFPPTSRIQNGRIWGPAPMEDHAGWQWRFRITRDPATPEMFRYWFEVAPIGASESGWLPFIDGSFVATGGVRKGMGHFHIGTDALRLGGFFVEINAKGEMLKDLFVMYSTTAFPIWVDMTLVLYPHAADGDFVNTTSITYHHEAQANGQGAMVFSGTDSETGATILVESRWLATGRGRADATATDGTNPGATWTQCWNDSFEATYNNKTWDPAAGNFGDPALDCPAISTL